MKNRYFEVVIEGDYNFIKGFLDGFQLGKNENYSYYFSEQTGIEYRKLPHILHQWITFELQPHHLIMEEALYYELTKAYKHTTLEFKIDLKYIKSANVIQKASFNIYFKTFVRSYAQQIKSILKGKPSSILLEDYTPQETINISRQPEEEEDYVFEGNAHAVGDIDTVISFRNSVQQYPLIELSPIHLLV